MGSEPAQVWDRGSKLGTPVVLDTSDERSTLALFAVQFRQQFECVEEGRIRIKAVRGQLLVGQGVVDGQDLAQP